METTLNTDISKKVFLIIGIVTAIFIGLTTSAMADTKDSTALDSKDYQENYELLKDYFDNQLAEDTTEKVVIYDNDYNVILDVTVDNKLLKEASAIMIQQSDFIMQEGTTRYFVMN